MQAEVADAGDANARADVGETAPADDPNVKARTAREPRKHAAGGVVQPNVFGSWLERRQGAVEMEEQRDHAARLQTAGHLRPATKQMHYIAEIVWH